MTTLYWHDYETFGADPARDRPVQFAGLRTDLELNPVGEPLQIYCRPPSDYLPHPEACLITGITPQQALAKGVAEPDFIRPIVEQLSRPGTCGVGYNSLRFDDEVTRYTLYRNFHDPYAREWQAGNSRWDLIDVMRMCYALRPAGIEWPHSAAGKVSFKLEQLTGANGIEHHGAHDALSDVQATIALARLVRSAQPRLYEYAFQLRDKRRAAELLNLSRAQPVLHVSSRFAIEHGCSALVLPLAMHPTNKNGVIVVDLSQDPVDLLDLDAQAIRHRLYTPAHALPPGESRIALKLIHLNRSPMVVTPRILDGDGYQRLGIDPSLCQRHAQLLLAAGPEFASKLREVFDSPAPGDPDPESQLYSGFVGAADRAVLNEVLRAEPEQLARFAPRLRDARLAPLLFRYRARHFPDTLDASEREQWQAWCRRRLTEPALANDRSLVQYQAMIDGALGKPGISPADRHILVDLRQYGLDLATACRLSGSDQDNARPR